MCEKKNERKKLERKENGEKHKKKKGQKKHCAPKIFFEILFLFEKKILKGPGI